MVDPCPRPPARSTLPAVSLGWLERPARRCMRRSTVVLAALLFVMGLGWGRVDVAAADMFSGTPRLELLLQPLGDSYAEAGSFDLDFTSSEIPARAQGRDLVLTVTAEGDASFSVTTTASLEPGKGWSPVESTEEVDADGNTQIVVPLDSQESLELIGQHLLVMGDVAVYDETAKTTTVTATLRIDDGPALDEFEASANTIAWYKAQGVHTPSPASDEAGSPAILSQSIVADGGAQGNGQVATVIEAGSLSASESRKKPSVVAYQAPVNTTLDCDSVEVEVGSRTLARNDDAFTSLCYDRRLLIDFSADPFTATDAPIKPVITVRSDITARGMLLGLGRVVVLDADTGYTMLEATPPQPTPAPTGTEPTTASTDPAPAPAEPVAREAASSAASKLPWAIAGGLVLAGAIIVVALIKRRAQSAASAPLDLEDAIRRGASLHDETWFADMTTDAANLFRSQLGTIVRPDESVSVAMSAPVDDGAAQPGLLLVTDEGRFVVCWATGFAGRHKQHESYPLGSVPCTLTRTTVAGIPGDAWVLQLGSRRVVMPSKQLGEDLRGTFAGGSIPA